MSWTLSVAGSSRIAGAFVAVVILASSVLAVAGAAVRAADPVCAMACCRDATECCCRTGGDHGEIGSTPEIASRSAVSACADDCAAVSTGLGQTTSVLETVPGGVGGPCAAKPPPADRALAHFSHRVDRSAPRAPPVLSA